VKILVEEIRGHEGEWLIIKNNKVVAKSNSAEKMFRLADEKYHGKDVIVTKVLSANASFY